MCLGAYFHVYNADYETIVSEAYVSVLVHKLLEKQTCDADLRKIRQVTGPIPIQLHFV